MGSSEDEESSSLLEAPLLQVNNSGLFTGDASIDINGNPALKHTTGNWKSCPFILGTECCERLAYYGIAKNLVTFLKMELREGNDIAARSVTTWQGTCYLTPLIGAFLADSYWGKYWTIVAFSTVYLVGMVMLTLSSSIPAFGFPFCEGPVCSGESSAHLILFFFGLYTIALGAGGIRPCVSPFGADQFDDTDPLERISKGSFFNWYSFSINIGSLISGTVIVWVQDNNGWGLGFFLPTLFMAIAIGSFLYGSKTYRFQKPGGSPLTRVCQVVVASFWKWNIDLPHDSTSLYEIPGKSSAIEGSRKLEHTAEFRFLDKAAVVSNLNSEDENSHNPWRLCTVTQVEELKVLVRMFPIWATNIVFSAVCAQTSSMFVEQGMVLDKNLGRFPIPPASLSTFDVVSVLIWVPIYDRILVPIVRRFTGMERGLSELQRFGIGLILSILAMIAAAMVEARRLQVASAKDLIHQKVEVPMSIIWQIPQYCLIGSAEVFSCVGQYEFSYNQSPDAMRSLSFGFLLLTISLGSYLGSFIMTILTWITTRGGGPGWVPDNLNEGHLDYFFWLMAGLSLLNLMVFVYCAAKYRCKRGS